MKTHLNLLPWKCRRSQMIRLRLRQWSLPWGATVGAVVVLFLIQWSRDQAAQQRAEELDRQCVPVESLRSEVRTLRGRLAELTRREAILAPLDNPRPALTLLGMVSQSAEDCAGRLRVEQLMLRPLAEGTKTSAGPSAPASAAGTASLTIKGIALDNLAVARFVVALRQTKAFDRVELKSSEGKTPAREQLCAFEIECGY